MHVSNIANLTDYKIDKSIEDAISEDIRHLNFAVEHTAGLEYLPLVKWFRLARPDWKNIIKTRATARTALILYLCSDLRTGLVEKTASQIMEMWYSFKAIYGGDYISEKTLYNQTLKVRDIYKPYVLSVGIPMNTRTYTRTSFNLGLMVTELNNNTIGQLFRRESYADHPA